MFERIALIGLSGSGKSSLAPLVAERLGWTALDTDSMVEQRFGLSIPEIFARFGEQVFRAAEREALIQATARRHVVIATGGGAVLDERNWILLRSATVVVHLQASIATLAERLRSQAAANAASARPLLAGNVEARLRALWDERRSLYQRADVVVSTEGRTPSQVVDEIVSEVRSRAARGLVPLVALASETGRSEIFVASGLLRELGRLARHRWPGARRAYLITDEQVGRSWMSPVCEVFRATGFDVVVLPVPSGESSKTLEMASWLLDRMLESGIERHDVVVALGGGVIGDLAGFVASIVLRGVGLLQVPTSLLAMVDASVGGKTGVDHRLGKNLIGTIYQPHLVIADPQVFATLPEPERRSGWAEVVKHAMIECTATGAAEPSLLGLLRQRRYADWWGANALDEVVRRNVAIKASVVAQDQRELGLRRILNYGHTLGHAIEAASGYRVRHGEAVALGLRAVARIAHRMGLCDAALVHLQDELLDDAGLPRTASVPLDDVFRHLRYDKKVVGGRPTWILPVEPGRVVVRQDVPEELVREVAATMLTSKEWAASAM
ncbi:MAG: 3-dehydroquinate synthase [Thermomicrobium sp.]|nr:3-dehydroquinate synthase [Thermomicrobium sp.]MCS7246367.1 3-dehydroquinate synthase [Thermomicrobium sp.]MDW7982382.1 3-dehydroquinate synthase [Thermomicrobium sp.]